MWKSMEQKVLPEREGSVFETIASALCHTQDASTVTKAIKQKLKPTAKNSKRMPKKYFDWGKKECSPPLSWRINTDLQCQTE